MAMRFSSLFAANLGIAAGCTAVWPERHGTVANRYRRASRRRGRRTEACNEGRGAEAPRGWPQHCFCPDIGSRCNTIGVFAAADREAREDREYQWKLCRRLRDKLQDRR